MSSSYFTETVSTSMEISISILWVGEPDYVDGRCPEVSGVLVPSRCSLDFTPVTSTVASPNPPATISEASSAIEKSYMSPLPKCPLFHLQIFTSKTRQKDKKGQKYSVFGPKITFFDGIRGVTPFLICRKYFLRKTFGGFGGYPPLFWKKIRQTVFETLPIISSKMRKRKEETSMI